MPAYVRCAGWRMDLPLLHLRKLRRSQTTDISNLFPFDGDVAREVGVGEVLAVVKRGEVQ